MTHRYYFLTLLICSLGMFSCNDKPTTSTETTDIAQLEEQSTPKTAPKQKLSEAFKTYWYAGEAEITSYRLEQARYGELREGTAVLVYVTEDFVPETQVKADNYDANNTSVLKLNAAKNFNTGIYPYSIMQSTFFPVANNQHALKVTASVQEWCGHVYAQLNNRDMFQVKAHSYFQSEGDQSLTMQKTWLENELWTKLRINPKSLPTGTLEIIPSLEYTRLKHKDIKAYKANVLLEKGKYTLSYPELKRTLTINFNPEFPHDILGWEETIPLGNGASAQSITTKATRLKTLKSDYWNKNSNADLHLREVLKLE